MSLLKSIEEQLVQQSRLRLGQKKRQVKQQLSTLKSIEEQFEQGLRLRRDHHQRQDELSVSCKDHPTAHLIEDFNTGDMICNECGLVVGDRVIYVVDSEWRSYNNDAINSENSDPSIVGSTENPLSNERYLSSTISDDCEGEEATVEKVGVLKDQNQRLTMSSCDSALKSESAKNPLSNERSLSAKIGACDGEGKLALEALKDQNPRSKVSGTDPTLKNAFKSIKKMSDQLNIPQTISQAAKKLYKVVHEKRDLIGKSEDAVAAACLYVACRQRNASRTFKEISNVADSSLKQIKDCYISVKAEVDVEMKVVTTDDFMERFCSNLKLPKVVELAARMIARRTTHMDLVLGRSPIIVTAAAIYMASQASKEPRTLKKIGKAAGVPEKTILETYKLMYTKADILFPYDFEFVTPIDQLPVG